MNAIQASLDELRRDQQAAQEEQTAGGVDVGSDPDVQAAATALAEAIAKAQGVDLPLAVAGGFPGTVLELPEEFTQFGGVGIGVMVAPPTEAARTAGR